MKIDRITLTHIRIPLVEPFRISNGEVAEKDGIIVSVQGEGLTGYGEASPMSGSFYSSDTPESTWADLRERIIPALLLLGPCSIEEVNKVLAGTGANPFARAGCETAFWDLEAQQHGVPLYRHLGGRRAAVECGLAVGIYERIPQLLAAIEKHLSEGYTRLKIKIQPGWDRAPLVEVRRQFGDIPLMVDANGAYRREDWETLKQLDDFDLIMIEQPLGKSDLEGHAQLQAALRTPVCLDESAADAVVLERALRLKACRIVNIKIQRVGGLFEALRVHDLCQKSGIPVWGGTMPELGIGSVQTLHLSTLPGFLFPTDVQSSLRWFLDDCIDPLITVEGGKIRLPESPGNGFRTDLEKMRKYLIQEELFVS
jgi:O-succinylbenzoate synthase